MFLKPTIRARVRAIDVEIIELQAALKSALLSGAESASQSSAGAAQSYKRFAPSEYRHQIQALRRERADLIQGGRKRRTSPDFG